VGRREHAAVGCGDREPVGRSALQGRLHGADRINFHHDGKQISTGEILNHEYQWNHSDTATWRGFGLRTFDPATGDETWEWQSQYGYDQGVLPSGRGDVYHANWVDILDSDDGPTAYVSMCNRYQVMAVDVATKDVKWLFGPGATSRSTTRTVPRCPIRSSPPASTASSLTRHEPILVYDNGWATGQSRTAEFQLDLDAMTATLEWSWTETGWYESVLGDADWLPDGHVLLDQAHMECASGSGRPTQIVEVDQATGGVAVRLTLFSRERLVVQSRTDSELHPVPELEVLRGDRDRPESWQTSSTNDCNYVSCAVRRTRANNRRPS
jgi:hypothetical protein